MNYKYVDSKSLSEGYNKGLNLEINAIRGGVIWIYITYGYTKLKEYGCHYDKL